MAVNRGLILYIKSSCTKKFKTNRTNRVIAGPVEVQCGCIATCHVMTSWSGSRLSLQTDPQTDRHRAVALRLSLQTAAGLRNGTVGGVRQIGVENPLGSLHPRELRARTWKEYEHPGTRTVNTPDRAVHNLKSPAAAVSEIV